MDTNTSSAPARKAKKRTPPAAVLVGGLFAVAGTLAPDLTARLVKRLLFTPSRAKLHDAARAVLAAARTETLTVGDERVTHYLWGEAGPRVLLVHGWSGDVGHMTAFVEPLRRAGYQVVALDLPAHGKSSGKRASVKHFERAIAGAAQVYGPFTGVIAHSLGAAGVTYALSRGLRCERAVFVGPVGSLDSVWKNARRMMNLPAKVMPRVVRHAERWLDVSFEDLDPARLASRQSTPLLVVHDRGDRECPFADAEALVARWPGAKLLATEQLGHNRVLRDPEILRQAVAFVSTRESMSA